MATASPWSSANEPMVGIAPRAAVTVGSVATSPLPAARAAAARVTTCGEERWLWSSASTELPGNSSANPARNEASAPFHR